MVITKKALLPTLPSLASIQGRVRLRQLALVLALTELGSMRKAADRISVTQPAATKMLHELEQSLGLELFDRGTRGMTPTVFGHAVVRYAHLILNDLEGLREELAALAAGSAGKVSVGTIMAAAPGLLADTIAQLKQRHPMLEVSVTMDTSDMLLPLLMQGRLDVVIGRQTEGIVGAELSFESLGQEALSVVVGPAHPLASARPSLRELGVLPWILQHRSSPLRQLLEAAFRDVHMDTPINVVETNSILTTTTLLQMTQMVALVPTSVAQHYAASGMLVILPLKLKRVLEPFGVITRRQRVQPPALREFMAVLRARGRG